jgi:hypothetical protein
MLGTLLVGDIGGINVRLRRIVGRWILATVLLVALFVVTTTLQGIWPPLAWVIPVLAAACVVVIVGRALWSGYSSARG